MGYILEGAGLELRGKDCHSLIGRPDLWTIERDFEIEDNTFPVLLIYFIYCKFIIIYLNKFLALFF